MVVVAAVVMTRKRRGRGQEGESRKERRKEGNGGKRREDEGEEKGRKQVARKIKIVVSLQSCVTHQIQLGTETSTMTL